MRIRQLYNLIALVMAVLAVQVFLPTQVLAATYVSQAVVVSTDLLSGSSATSISNFHYNITSLPATSSVRIQFSKDNATWYSATGTLAAWTTISTVGGADLNLAAFVTAAGWTSGNSFYYKLELNATPDLTQTPALEDIRLDYSLASGYEKTFVFDSAGNVGIGTNSPGYKLDIAVTANDRGINIANTATKGINYGVYSAATGASTANYGGYFQSIGAASNYGLGVAPMTGTTSIGLDIGALSGATANTGISIGNISGGASTNYGINLGNLTGGTGSSGYQINAGNIIALASGSWGGINLGTRMPAASATIYGINIGNTLVGAGTATYGINIGTNASAATNNYGLKIGAISGAGTTNTGLYVDTVSGATNNYAAIFAGGNVGIGTVAPLLKLDVAGSGRFTGAVSSTLTGTADPTASTTLVGTGTLFLTQLVVGDRITVNAETRTVAAIASNTSLTVDTAFSDTAAASVTKLPAIFLANDSANAVKLVLDSTGNLGIGTTAPRSILDLGDKDLGNEASGRVLTIGRNTNASTTSAGAVNFLSKGGINGYVWQDAAGNMRISTSSPTNTNDATAGTVVGTQGSVRDTKQDISDYTNYDGALQMVVSAPLHYFRYKNEVAGYGSDNPLAKERIGFISDEVNSAFMWGNSIDQVSVNGILMGSIKAQQQQIGDLKLQLNNSGLINASSTDETGQGGGFVEMIRNALSYLGMTLQNGIASLKEMTVDRMFAKKATIDVAKIKEMEMTDKSGNAWCLSLDENGEWAKTKGECGTTSESSNSGSGNSGGDMPSEPATPAKSNAKSIITFEMANSVAVNIDETNHTISLTMPSGTDVTALSPTITVSENATTTPATGEAQNFTNSVTYTVTAQDGTAQDYVVTVTVVASEPVVPAVEKVDEPVGEAPTE